MPFGNNCFREQAYTLPPLYNTREKNTPKQKQHKKPCPRPRTNPLQQVDVICARLQQRRPRRQNTPKKTKQKRRKPRPRSQTIIIPIVSR